MSRFERGPLREDPEFLAYYERWLAPMEASKEAGRKGGLSVSVIRGIQSLLLVAALSAGMLWFAESFESGGGWLALVTLGIVILTLAVWTIDPARTHKLATKDRVTPLVVGYFGDFSFDRKGEFGLSPFADWEILEPPDRRKFGDVIIGSYRGVPLRIAELSLARRTPRARGRREYTHVFSGLYVDFVLPGPATALTLVVNQNPMWDRRARQRGWTPLAFAATGYQAYAAGDADDAYPLPEALAELLDRLRGQFNATHVLAAFGQSRLVILLEGASNAFEPSVTRASTLLEEAESIREQLGALVAAVNVLDIAASTEVRDAPRPVDEKALDAKAELHGDDFKGLGCLPLMVLTTALFLVYGFILKDVEYPSLAFAFALVASPILASTALKLYQTGQGKSDGGVVWQLVKVALATVPVYFLLQP